MSTEIQNSAGYCAGERNAQLPEPTLRRLPWYLAYLTTLRHDGVANVSSTRIAAEVGVDASQIAKDLSFLSIKGKTRIGYEVAALEEALRVFLGFDSRHLGAIVGVGSLGSALIADRGLQRYGLEIVAGFDIDEKIVGTMVNGVPVYHLDEVDRVCREMGLSIAAVTVPVEFAQQVADKVTSAGIRAVWNFTPCRILVPEGCVVQNTSIYAPLAVMYNRLAAMPGTDRPGCRENSGGRGL